MVDTGRVACKITQYICLVLIAAIFLGACSFLNPEEELVLNPHMVVSRQFSGQLVTGYQPNQVISPDGKYLLAQQWESDSSRMIAVALESDGLDDVVLQEVKQTVVNENWIQHHPIGWTSPTNCLFLVFGIQPQGPHKDQRGVAIISGDVIKKTTEEIGFIELQQGYFRSVSLINHRAKVYLHVSKALWEIDINQKSLKLIKDDLPTYDALFNIKISPTGEYAVYDMRESDKYGVYLLDIATGEERELLPDGKTLSFLPTWSPDGKYIAVYTADEKPNGDSLPRWERYQVFNSEDGLLPIAPRITIVDTEGKVHNVIEVPEKNLAYATWGIDSKNLGFLAGVPRSGQEVFPSDQRPGALIYDSVMILDLSAGNDQPICVADLNALSGFGDVSSVAMSFIEPSGQGVFFTVSGADIEKTELWYASKDRNSKKICDGSWMYYGMEPVYRDHIVGVINFGQNTTIRLIGVQDSIKLSESDNSSAWAVVQGYQDDLLIIGKTESEGHVLEIYRMYGPKTD